MTDESEFDNTTQIVMNALNTEVPAGLENRMRARLDELKARMDSGVIASIKMPSGARRLISNRTGIVSFLAVASVLVLVLIRLGSNSVLAQLTDAVASMPWLHAIGSGPDGQLAEVWFSGKHGVAGWRTGDSFVFVDYGQGTMDLFGPPMTSNVIQRMPLQQTATQGIHAARRSFLALMGGNLRQVMESEDQAVLEQTKTSIYLDGKELIEHRFVIGPSGKDQPHTENLLRVDPQTGLPISWIMKIDDKTNFDLQVSYPDYGPLSIVALGVPETTPLNDQSPSIEFKRMLANGKSTRLRFENYHGIVVNSFKLDEATAFCLTYRIWRKGNRWRIDRCIPSFTTPVKDPELSDPKWWLNQAHAMRSYPNEICDGKELRNFEAVWARQAPGADYLTVTDAADPRFVRIDSLHVYNRCRIMSPDDPGPQNGMSRDILPEFWGYEHLTRFAQIGFRVETRSVKLDDQPMGFVEGLEKPLFERAPKDNGYRFWLDPRRGNMIVRKEWFQSSQSNTPTGTSVVLDAAVTAQGLWYPTIIRDIGNTVSLEDGSRGDTYRRYFIEVGSEIADELFNPELVDEKNFWTQSK
jgi:hypothetical protein